MYQNDLLNDVMNEYFEMIPPQKQRTKNMLNSNTKDIIDLVKYSEDIASEENPYCNNLFNSGINLLRENGSS